MFIALFADYISYLLPSGVLVDTWDKTLNFTNKITMRGNNSISIKMNHF